MEDPDKGSSGRARGTKSILIRERRCNRLKMLDTGTGKQPDIP